MNNKVCFICEKKLTSKEWCFFVGHRKTMYRQFLVFHHACFANSGVDHADLRLVNDPTIVRFDGSENSYYVVCYTTLDVFEDVVTSTHGRYVLSEENFRSLFGCRYASKLNPNIDPVPGALAW